MTFELSKGYCGRIKHSNPLDSTCHYACKYVKHIHELLGLIQESCTNIPKPSTKLLAVTPLNKELKPSTNAIRSKPSGNTKKDRIPQPSSSNEKKVEARPRNVKSSLNKTNRDIELNGTMVKQSSKLNVNSDLKCVQCKVFTKMGYTWRPTGRTFTIVGNAFPLTRITIPTKVPTRKLIARTINEPNPVVTKVFTQKTRKSKTKAPVSKPKVYKFVSANIKEPNTSWGSTISNVPSSHVFGRLSGCSKHMTRDRSQLTNFVYYMEGLRHNLVSIAQLCDSNLVVAFRQHTCFIRNLDGVNLLTGLRGNNLYTLSLGDMMGSSPICLLLKASKTKSWLWHRWLSHLNFGAINQLAKHGLVRGLPKLKFEKDHLCSTCAMGKSKKKPHKPKSKDTNQEKLYLLHMDLRGPIRTESVNGKNYILGSKDEAPDFIIKFLKMIQKVSISHETSIARTPQQNGVVERRNYTLIEAGRTMLIYAKAPLFLWAEAVATALLSATQPMTARTWESYNQRLILVFSSVTRPQRKYYVFTTDIPDESLKVGGYWFMCWCERHAWSRPRIWMVEHDGWGWLSDYYGVVLLGVDGCRAEKLRLKAKGAEGSPVSKPKVYKFVSANIKEPNTSWGSTISNVPSSHVFGRLSGCSKHMTRDRSQLTNFVYTWKDLAYLVSIGYKDYLFQPLFDELLNPPTSVDAPVPEVIAPIPEVVAPAPDVLIGSPSSITIDQDAPSAKSNSDASSSLEVIPTIVHSDTPAHEHISKWSKDHPLENIIGELDRPVSIRLQLHEQALFCYFDAFPIAVEPKTYKDALTQSC
ncbi:retrovirus-related pol polyprotein from transposon TNT 1-94 [Tanacetum coccineum]